MKTVKIDQKNTGENTFPEHEYREYAPCAELKPYINCFWSYHSESAVRDPIKHIILPDGCIDIIFDFNSDCTDPAFVIGAMTGPIINQHKHLLGIRFQPVMAPSVS